MPQIVIILHEEVDQIRISREELRGIEILVSGILDQGAGIPFLGGRILLGPFELGVVDEDGTERVLLGQLEEFPIFLEVGLGHAADALALVEVFLGHAEGDADELVDHAAQVGVIQGPLLGLGQGLLDLDLEDALLDCGLQVGPGLGLDIELAFDFPLHEPENDGGTIDVLSESKKVELLLCKLVLCLFLTGDRGVFDVLLDRCGIACGRVVLDLGEADVADGLLVLAHELGQLLLLLLVALLAFLDFVAVGLLELVCGEGEVGEHALADLLDLIRGEEFVLEGADLELLELLGQCDALDGILGDQAERGAGAEVVGDVEGLGGDLLEELQGAGGAEVLEAGDGHEALDLEVGAEPVFDQRGDLGVDTLVELGHEGRVDEEVGLLGRSGGGSGSGLGGLVRGGGSGGGSGSGLGGLVRGGGSSGGSGGSGGSSGGSGGLLLLPSVLELLEKGFTLFLDERVEEIGNDSVEEFGRVESLDREVGLPAGVLLPVDFLLDDQGDVLESLDLGLFEEDLGLLEAAHSGAVADFRELGDDDREHLVDVLVDFFFRDDDVEHPLCDDQGLVLAGRVDLGVAGEVEKIEDRCGGVELLDEDDILGVEEGFLVGIHLLEQGLVLALEGFQGIGLVLDGNGLPLCVIIVRVVEGEDVLDPVEQAPGFGLDALLNHDQHVGHGEVAEVADLVEGELLAHQLPDFLLGLLDGNTGKGPGGESLLGVDAVLLVHGAEELEQAVAGALGLLFGAGAQRLDELFRHGGGELFGIGILGDDASDARGPAVLHENLNGSGLDVKRLSFILHQLADPLEPLLILGPFREILVGDGAARGSQGDQGRKHDCHDALSSTGEALKLHGKPSSQVSSGHSSTLPPKVKGAKPCKTWDIMGSAWSRRTPRRAGGG